MEQFVETIRASSSLSGIQVSGTSHKIRLYTDTVILPLTGVAPSLSRVNEAIQEFPPVSYYYMVKVSTGHVLTTSIQGSLGVHLKALFPSSWESECIQYLGIYLSTPSTRLYEVIMVDY